MRVRIAFLTRPFYDIQWSRTKAHEKKAEEQETKPRFRPRWSGRVCESQHWRLAMARRLSMAAWFALAAVCRVGRRSLHRAESVVRHALQSRPEQYCGQYRRNLVLRLFLLQCANAGDGRLRPHVSANALRTRDQHDRNHERHLSARSRYGTDFRPLLAPGGAHCL